MIAPTVTPDQIAALLAASEVQTSTIFDKVTLVAVRLPSGFVLTASSGAVSKENYDEAVGAKICLQKIEDELWKLEGYHLQRSLESTPPPAAAPVPTVGRTVLYRLTEEQAQFINRRRAAELLGKHEWQEDARKTIGNPVSAGDVFPLVICRTWGDQPTSAFNGQVLLDGSDTLWVTSVSIETTHRDGAAYWPPRA